MGRYRMWEIALAVMLTSKVPNTSTAYSRTVIALGRLFVGEGIRRSMLANSSADLQWRVLGEKECDVVPASELAAAKDVGIGQVSEQFWRVC